MTTDLELFWKSVERFPHWRPDPEVQRFVEAQIRGELIESVNLNKLQDMSTITYWHAAKTVIGFVSPTLQWARSIKKVVGDGTVLEVGSGTGLLAKYLNAVGISIRATDNYAWHKREDFEWKQFFDVENIDFLDAIRKYRTDYLLLCWPLLEDPFAKKAAELFTELNPDGKTLYIGEGSGGCTADDEFHEGVTVIDYLDESNRLYPQWCGLHDRVYLLKWVGSDQERNETQNI